jgi:class 3 adenylate cyclase
VLHRSEDEYESVEAGRYLASRIPGAIFEELCGTDHMPWAGDQEAVHLQVVRFVDSIHREESELDRILATILFTDIVDSTAQASLLGDLRWREVREQHDRLVRAQLARYRGREIKTLGDGFLAVFDGPARGVRCAEAISRGVRNLGIEVRAGLHIGEVELQGDDVAGLGVTIGARVAALAGASEVLVSSTIKDLVSGSKLVFADAGEHELKGMSAPWRLYRVVSD